MRARIDAVVRDLAVTGAALVLEVPGLPSWHLGAEARARVRFESTEAVQALEKRDLVGVGEAFLRGEITVEGDLREALKLTDVITPGPTRFVSWLRALRRLRSASARRRGAIAAHYDRPPEFFLSWMERWRSYSHGLWEAPDEAHEEAQARKLERAYAALDLAPGKRVLDMGCGWGSFLEFAGQRGVQVHGITLSKEQHRFVAQRIREQALPCSVELVDFVDYQPKAPLDAAVFMGTFEHFPGYRFAARFLAEHLAPGGRIWADFVAERDGRGPGVFLERHVFPEAGYVSVPRLLDALIRAGFNVHELADDTASYALSCRAWAEAFEREAKRLAERFPAEDVRLFQLYLRAAEYFLETNQTQAYHLVAGLGPRRA